MEDATAQKSCQKCLAEGNGKQEQGASHKTTSADSKNGSSAADRSPVKDPGADRAAGINCAMESAETENAAPNARPEMKQIARIIRGFLRKIRRDSACVDLSISSNLLQIGKGCVGGGYGRLAADGHS